MVRLARTRSAQREVAPTTRPPSTLSRAFLPPPSASRSYRFWFSHRFFVGTSSCSPLNTSSNQLDSGSPGFPFPLPPAPQLTLLEAPDCIFASYWSYELMARI
ncbi:uncharacterized protein LOC144544562 [Carex rostrata]